MTAVSLLTADVVAAALVCPVAGVVVAGRRAALIAFVVLTGWILLSATILFASGLAPGAIGVAHVVLTAAAFAFAAIGRVCRTLLRDALDAIAVAVCLSVMVSFGIFAIGGAAGELPTESLNALLTANPLVAAAAAAGIDIFRTELLYRISPVPHQFFDYPAWQSSAGLFAAAAVAGASWARLNEGRATRRQAI